MSTDERGGTTIVSLTEATNGSKKARESEANAERRTRGKLLLTLFGNKAKINITKRKPYKESGGSTMFLKRGIALFLALLLALGCFSAIAETRQFYIEADSLDIARNSDVLIIGREGATYLAKPDGTVVSAGYDNISEESWTAFFRADAPEHEDKLHYKGLIDAEGRVIIPMQYATLSVLSDRWQLAFKCEPVEDEADSDYTLYFLNGSKEYYRFGAVDVYYDAVLEGTLSGEEYMTAYAYGDYLCVSGPNGEYTFYNKCMVKAPYISGYSDEFICEYVDDTPVYIHQGTGTPAFCAGCTLEEDEVDYIYLTEDNTAYDLRGNVVCVLEEGCSFECWMLDSRCASVKKDDKYGVVDVLTGEVLIPMEYDRLGEYCCDEVTLEGYVFAVKDGKAGYVRRGGEVTCDFEYDADDVIEEGLLSYVYDPEGGIVVLSAAAGILPERYESADLHTGALAFTAGDAEGRVALIGLNGKELIPFGEYDYIYVNDSATLAYGYNDDGYVVWTIDYADALEMPVL